MELLTIIIYAASAATFNMCDSIKCIWESLRQGFPDELQECTHYFINGFNYSKCFVLLLALCGFPVIMVDTRSMVRLADEDGEYNITDYIDADGMQVVWGFKAIFIPFL